MFRRLPQFCDRTGLKYPIKGDNHVFIDSCTFVHGLLMTTDLLLRERKSLIQERLRTEGRVLAVDLARELGVSEDTIRRDLREMAAAGLCERVYGGALPIPPDAGLLTVRVSRAPERKAALARVAVGFLRPRMTVFLDAGSANLAIAQAIGPELSATVITNTPLIAAALMEKPGIDVILIGGPLNRAVGAAVSARAQRDAELLRPDLAILGTCGADAEAGLTAFHVEDAEFKRLIASRSRSLLAAVTTEKLATAAPHTIVPIDGSFTLVLEADAPDSEVAALRARGANVVLAKEIAG
ncbi:DeoR family transcriptional regulator [Sinorhizobium medicae]|uniref:Transcriptional regulator, DeoR family n=2 Tax=Sinorhizobium medicae TaxID=110321 RepID=A0A508X2M7_9HYPH|nr:DeoR family transcriptional regulator [Sinorhizobium medicae]TWA27872.1 DeoR family transcriptional regulator [Sinorhizobium medicae]TWA40285.1 DeoR family transcriptional regulator [Sinorhizobium medicae]TWA41466.1 DeoR family transcriptional regulator [Sinorhizobium medicae]TWA46294.1 DeoR family transcriptional regulator [Sinorhizobium medicae]